MTELKKDDNCKDLGILIGKEDGQKPGLLIYLK